MIYVSTGCPASIGPEVSVSAASALEGGAWVLLGDVETLQAAAELVGVPPERLTLLPTLPAASAELPSGIYLHQVGAKLEDEDRKPGKPNQAAGAAQLAYVEAALSAAKAARVPMVTAAVSKAAIAHSGVPGAENFRGHTEWLQQRDGSSGVTMCFVGKKLSCSLVTTHIPLASVPKAIKPEGVSQATLHLAKLLQMRGCQKPRVVVCSLNPHAGEDELLGEQEKESIRPGVALARQSLRDAADVTGPIGAETAFRHAAAGHYDGVVAMYHDQATIPMKLVEFGDAVNVTMGLSILRTSVDHGTAYDIAWQGKADDKGMRSAMELAAQVSEAQRMTRSGQAVSSP